MYKRQEFLKSLKDVKITVCENTAMAAKMVAESDRNDIAAISSKECVDLYGLEILKTHIQVSDNNYTRFICISKKMEIYPGANRISLILSLPHVPRSLYHTIAKFAAQMCIRDSLFINRISTNNFLLKNALTPLHIYFMVVKSP